MVNIPSLKVIFATTAFFYYLSAVGQGSPVLYKTTVVRNATTPAPFVFFENLTKKEGAPPDIQKIYQDKSGYLWFCLYAGQGLARFDGSKFTRFDNDPASTAYFPAKNVYDVMQDKNGFLWFSTDTGPLRYDPKAEKFQFIPFDGKPFYGTLFEDSGGRIWSGSAGDGVYYYAPDRDSMVLFPGKGVTNGYTGAFFEGASFDGFSNFTETPDGLIWAIATIGNPGEPGRCAIVSFSRDQHDIRFYLGEPLFKQKPIIQPAPGYQSLYFDKERNCFWLGGYGSGLLRFSLNGHRWERYYFSDNPDFANNILTIAPRNADQLWLGCMDGVKIFDIPSQQVFPVKTGISAAPEQCHHIFKDHRGTRWFANQSGLSQISPDRQQFPLEKIVSDDFQSESVLDVPATGEVWLMAYDKKGVFEIRAWQPKNNTWRGNQQTIGLPTKNGGDVWASRIASDGKIWVGLDGGVGWVDPQSLQLTIPNQALLKDKDRQRSNQLWVSDLCPGDNGDLWVTSWNAGLVQYDARNNQFICHTYQLGSSNQVLFNYAYRALCKDHSGNFFIGSMGTGLEKWNPANNDYKRYEPNPKNPKRVCGKFIACLKSDRKGQIWVGTESGLCRYLPGMHPDSSFQVTSVPPIWIYDIAVDAKERLWLKTVEGLVLYNPVSNKSTVFGEKQGMTLPFVERRPLYFDRFKMLWYGSTLRFNPDSIFPTSLRASPRLTGLKIHDQLWAGAVPIGRATRIELEPQQNTLRFEMTALDFDCRPGESLFKVKFDKGEEDTQWTDLGTQSFATYANLSPGTYHFRFLAGNVESGWMSASEAGHLTVVVHPYFYQTWWFRALLAALLLGFVATATAFYYRYQLRAHQLRAEKQQREAERQRLELEKTAAVAEGQRKVAESEMKLLRSQLNPHFLFNAMNSINRYILSNEREKASEYLGQFAQLTRSILDNSRSLTIPLADELKMLHNYLALESHRFQQNIHWTFTVSPDLDEEDVLVPSMFLQPFAENAILHGLAPKGGGHIAVEISQQEGSLQCVLRDDGVGRQPAAAPANGKPRHASVGMRLIAERLDAFAAIEGQSAAFVLHDLKDEAGQPLGTEVVIRLPLVVGI